MNERRATLVGFSAASAVPPLILAGLALPTEQSVHRVSEALLFVGVAFLTFLPYSLLFTLLIGGPSFWLCKRLGLVTWWLALAVGALGGILVSLMQPANEPVGDAMLKYVPLGTIAGLAFWLVWKRGAEPGN